MTESLTWGTTSRVSVDGVDIHVEQAGDGPDLALLHGFSSGTFGWAALARLLVDRHRVTAWDRPPFGKSDRPEPRRGPTDPYRVDAENARTAAVLAATDVERPVLVGHSAGTLAAAHAIAAGVVAPRAVVLIAPALTSGPPMLVQSMARLPGVRSGAKLALRLALPRADRFLERMSAHPSDFQRATAAETARALARPGTADALWHLVETWQPPVDPAGAFTKSDTPTLVIVGADDRIISPDVAVQLADRIGATCAVVDGAGHAPQEQVPEVVADHITSFLHDLP